MIAIIDYGMGNLRSVEKGFLKIGADAKVTSDPKAVDDARAIVLPGVGAFRDCMRYLEEMSLLEAVVKAIEKGKPYLGICLGLQILFTESEEFGRSKGLNIFSGNVVRSPENNLKVPHMGWNTVNILIRPPISENLPRASLAAEAAWRRTEPVCREAGNPAGCPPACRPAGRAGERHSISPPTWSRFAG